MGICATKSTYGSKQTQTYRGRRARVHGLNFLTAGKVRELEGHAVGSIFGPRRRVSGWRRAVGNNVGAHGVLFGVDGVSIFVRGRRGKVGVGSHDEDGVEDGMYRAVGVRRVFGVEDAWTETARKRGLTGLFYRAGGGRMKRR